MKFINIFFNEIDLNLWDFEILFSFLNFYILILCLVYKITNKSLFCIIYTNIILHILFYILFPIFIIQNDLYYLLFWIKIIILLFYSIILFFLLGHYCLNFTYEIIILLNFSVIALCLLLTSNNLVTFLLCLELYSYIMYIIVTSKTYSILSSESGFKYIIIGALSIAFFLIGMCILYFKIGTLNLHELMFLTNNLLINKNLFSFHLSIAYIFLLIGLLIKLGSVPFHMWYVDIYQTLDYWLLAFIGSIPKLSLTTFLILLSLHCNFLEFFNIKILLSIFSFICLFIGNLMLLLQLNLKRLLLYYSIQSNALVLIFIILQHEWTFLILYLIMYIISYLYITLLLASLYLWSTSSRITNIYTLLSFIIIHPILGWHWIIGFLTLGSMPPFILFISKILILFTLNKVFFYFYIMFIIYKCSYIICFFKNY